MDVASAENVGNMPPMREIPWKGRWFLVLGTQTTTRATGVCCADNMDQGNKSVSIRDSPAAGNEGGGREHSVCQNIDPHIHVFKWYFWMVCGWGSVGSNMCVTTVCRYRQFFYKNSKLNFYLRWLSHWPYMNTYTHIDIDIYKKIKTRNVNDDFCVNDHCTIH